MARACGAAPLSWEHVPSVAVEELGDSMGLMMLRNRVSTPLMTVFFTFVFPSGMAPLRPLTVANSSAHSAASFAFFSDSHTLPEPSVRVPFPVQLQVLAHSEPC